MSVNLCIDWGNSSVKAAIFNDDKLQEAIISRTEDAYAVLGELTDKHNPVKGIICSVVQHPEEVEQLVKEKIKHFIKLDNNTRLPINNAYSSPGTLGYDRVALAVGAYMQTPDKNNLIISIGTCITYNFVQKNKTFRGGAISPGLYMRLKAMHHFTDKLPEVNVAGELLLLGYDTETCMRSGAVYGMAREIDGMLQDFQQQYPEFNATLTGGDAAFFEGKLKNKIFADPELLLKGLNLILNHNVSVPR